MAESALERCRRLLGRRDTRAHAWDLALLRHAACLNDVRVDYHGSPREALAACANLFLTLRLRDPDGNDLWIGVAAPRSGATLLPRVLDRQQEDLALLLLHCLRRASTVLASAPLATLAAAWAGHIDMAGRYRDGAELDAELAARLGAVYRRRNAAARRDAHRLLARCRTLRQRGAPLFDPWWPYGELGMFHVLCEITLLEVEHGSR
ncbi:MAG: hypothetical protein IPG43_15535 [Proteobacteria bacterium]|nr:hypothetical protein [Pseudomonadota bacterium]